MIYFAQKAFIVRDRHLLVVRKSFDDPSHPGKWEVPGGRMNEGEEIEDHIRREVFEETGIEISPGELFSLWSWRIPGQLEKSLQDTVVAVARYCIYTGGYETNVHQVPEDFLSTIEWISFEDIGLVDFIPNMLPIVAEFQRRFTLQ